MRDRHALVTGGTGGLGRAVTTAFVRRGARVTLPVLERVHADGLLAELGSDADRVIPVVVDLGDEAAVRTMVDGMERVEVLVHLVGGFAMGETATFAVEDLRRQLELNVVTAFVAIKHALRRMHEHGYGRIVTVGSRAAVDPTAKMGAYAAAKAGVLALTRAVADETRGTGITANCVLPSVIDTPANRKSMGADKADRWVAPERLAEVVAFLASGAAADLRGSALRAYAHV